MEAAPLPRDYEQLQEIDAACDPAKTDHSTTEKTQFTNAEISEAIATTADNFEPPISIIYRPFCYRRPEMSAWSPVQLFLFLLAPILDLLLFHTNLSAQRGKKPWKPLTLLELRRWIAIRLDMALHLSGR